MGRLIDADELVAKLEADAEEMEEPIAKMFTYAAVNDVKNAPTVDAVPVVRCRDCRYYEPDFGCPWGGCNHPHWSTRTLGFEVSEDGYCHRAERREGENDAAD